jgi:hypothetical protein
VSAVTVDLWIGGKNVPASSGKIFDDSSPLDDSVLARVAEAGREGTIDDIETMTEWKWITIQL